MSLVLSLIINVQRDEDIRDQGLTFTCAYTRIYVLTYMYMSIKKNQTVESERSHTHFLTFSILELTSGDLAVLNIWLRLPYSS